MNEYIKRLVDCGYSFEMAEEICHDMILNLSIVELQMFVESVESHVAAV